MDIHQFDNLKKYITRYLINESSRYLNEFEDSVSRAVDFSLDVIIKKIFETIDPEKLNILYEDIHKLDKTHQNILHDLAATLSDNNSLDELSQNFAINLELNNGYYARLISKKMFIKIDSANRIFKMCILLILCYLAEQKVAEKDVKTPFEVKNNDFEIDDTVKTIEKLKAPRFLKRKLFYMFAFFVIGLSIYYLTSFKKRGSKIEVVVDTETQPQNIEFEDIDKLGDYIDYLLPSDDIITIPEKGCEKALLDFVLDNSNNLDDSSLCLVLDRIHFKDRNPDYFVDSEEQIKNIALILSSFPKSKIIISGFTDNLGNPVSNKNLSLKRAISIKKALVKMKISESRIITKGFGEEFPLLVNSNEENRKQNRRISIKILNK